MILEELRQEAETRASSPEGLAALIHVLLTQFEDELNRPEQTSQFLITTDRLSDLFSHVQTKTGNAASYIEFNPEDYKILCTTGTQYGAPELTMGGRALWGAEVRTNPKLSRNSVILTDIRGRMFHRQWYNDPESRLRKLLRQYVLCKRQYEYWHKNVSHTVGVGRYRNLQDHYEEKIAAFKEQITELKSYFSAEQLQRIKDDVGSRMSFGPFTGTAIQSMSTLRDYDRPHGE